MASPNPPGGNDPWVKPPWIDDAVNYKEMYRDINQSINLMKLELVAFSAGLTLVKLDYSLFKADEKGFSFRGKQIFTYPWSDQKKYLEEKIERNHRRNERDLKKIEDQLAKARTAQGPGAGGRRDMSSAANALSRVERIEKTIAARLTVIETRAKKVHEIQEKTKKRKEELDKSRAELVQNAKKVKEASNEITAATRQALRSLNTLSGAV
ncbi:hypothetical protein [Streptomyces sp. NPDC088261]|uniref:hypothetical protein n=1 Tax=Streptomyces sp. NPDC088261 TaxID=3365851 RepID=UPI003825B8DB